MQHVEALPPGHIPESVTAVLRPLETVGLTRSNGAKRYGGKAANLGRLVRDGMPIPHGWVLEAKHFIELADQRLPRGHDVSSLIKVATTRAGVDRAARARDRILGEPLPSELRDVLDALWTAIEPVAPWGLSVRSSATCEDEATSSLAGLATSILGVRGGSALELAIRQVWASLYLPRTLAYLARHGVRGVAMPVLIQVMVRARAAGVLFTAPPPGLEGERWGRGERLINATWGLGAPVVDGAVAADTVRLSLRGEVLGEIIADKRGMLQVGAAGVEQVAVPDERAGMPALSAAILGELARLATRLEASSRGPLDVEFAVEQDEVGREHLYLLQARPLTGGVFPEGGRADTVWSRANVGEALPGAATPLTWSIAKSFSDRGFRDAFAALGCRVPRGAVLVANVYGRFYLNLTNFMRIAAQVPGLTPRALLSASGGASESAITTLEQQVVDVHKRGFLVRAPFLAPSLIRRYARLERDVEAYEQRATRAKRSLLERDLSLLPDDALSTTLKQARDLLDETGGLMLTCASASLVAHLALGGVLKTVLKRPSARGGTSDDDIPERQAAIEPLAQALTGGIDDLDSASPGIALLEVAAIAQGDPAAREALAKGASSIELLPHGPTRAALVAFMDRFGDRAVREAELATPRWREDHQALLSMLVAAIETPSPKPGEALARARAIADRELAWLETRISRVEFMLVRSLVARAQGLTRLRERMRTWVTRILGMLRYVALDVDRRLRRIDHELEPGSVFFCTFDELTRALASGRADIGHVVRLRRAEHRRDEARPDPPSTFVGQPPMVTLPPASGPRWVGLPASHGVVEGPARVLTPGSEGLDLVRPGEILVSRTTDVGLSPLFLVAAGVVTELGGPLSHAAIVAREYGVPAVVSVAGATLIIRTGDLLRVDGDRGVVEKLEPKKPSGGR